MLMKKNTFEEEYFEGYYKDHVGDFSPQDLDPAINWFYGWLKYLNKFIDLTNGKDRKVLEIGCSIAAPSHILYDRGFNTTATDYSKYAVSKAHELAKSLKKNIKFAVVDVQKPIPLNAKYDIIIAFEVIEHLKNPTQAIKNMKAKLKDNGVLICSTPNGDHDVYIDPTHISVKPKNEWQKVFESVGFRKVIISQVTFVPFLYRFNKNLQWGFPIPIYSKFINSPLFIISYK